MEDNPRFWQALDTLISQSRIVIDRPKGTAHPRFPEMIYPLDYGYLAGTASMDGEGIDLWLGSLEPKTLDAVLCVADLPKGETELKLLLGCTDAEKRQVFAFQNRPPWMLALLVPRGEPSKKE